jgi:hypothetical protein
MFRYPVASTVAVRPRLVGPGLRVQAALGRSGPVRAGDGVGAADCAESLTPRRIGRLTDCCYGTVLTGPGAADTGADVHLFTHQPNSGSRPTRHPSPQQLQGPMPGWGLPCRDGKFSVRADVSTAARPRSGSRRQAKRSGPEIQRCGRRRRLRRFPSPHHGLYESATQARRWARDLLRDPAHPGLPVLSSCQPLTSSQTTVVLTLTQAADTPA